MAPTRARPQRLESNSEFFFLSEASRVKEGDSTGQTWAIGRAIPNSCIDIWMLDRSVSRCTGLVALSLDRVFRRVKAHVWCVVFCCSFASFVVQFWFISTSMLGFDNSSVQHPS